MSSTIFKTAKCGQNITAAVIRRHKHTLITGEGRLSVEAVGTQQQQQPHQQMHQVVASAQTSGLSLPPPSVFMPPNVKELEASEKAQFSPWRTRDTSSAHIAAFEGFFGSGAMRSESIRESSYNYDTVPTDRHVDVYDCNETVTLDSIIETNVPKPYGLSGQVPSQFSSPDCHRGQDDKYVAGDLQDHHQSIQSSSSKKSSGTAFSPFGSSGDGRGMWWDFTKVMPAFRAGHSNRLYGTVCYGGRLGVAETHPILNCPNLVRFWLNNSSLSGSGSQCGRNNVRNLRCIHTCMTARSQEQKHNGESASSKRRVIRLTSRQKMGRAVSQYGFTVVVFHVAISITSLGICYLLVSSGVDMTAFIKALGFNMGSGNGTTDMLKECITADQCGSVQYGEANTGNEAKNLDKNTRRVAGAATFVAAYAVHKVFAPVRMAITATSAPFIVRYLRRVGFLKPPKPKKL